MVPTLSPNDGEKGWGTRSETKGRATRPSLDSREIAELNLRFTEREARNKRSPARECGVSGLIDEMSPPGRHKERGARDNRSLARECGDRVEHEGGVRQDDTKSAERETIVVSHVSAGIEGENEGRVRQDGTKSWRSQDSRIK